MPQLMEVLEFLDNSGKIIAKRIPENGPCEIKWGAQLTVRENQEAVFFRDGKALDVFGAGRYVLKTQNLPLITKWVTSFGYGPTSPFRSEVYFISKIVFTNLKWGTSEPILFRDSELKMIRVRAYGIYSIQVADSILFINKIVGTRSIFTVNDIQDYLRNIIISKLTTVLSQEIKTVLNLPSSFDDLSVITKNKLYSELERIGLTIHDFFINSISVPPEVQEMIDLRSGLSAVGNLDDFMKYKVALSLESAAKNPSGTAGDLMGMGAGLGMGFMIPQIIKQALADSNINKTPESQTSPMEKLKKLKELLDIGAITKEEYERKKNKLLEEI